MLKKFEKLIDFEAYQIVSAFILLVYFVFYVHPIKVKTEYRNKCRNTLMNEVLASIFGICK